MDFDALYEQHFQRVYQYIFYMVSDTNLAEDLTQETFLRVYNGKFRQEAAMSTYIRQIARNLVYDHFRKKAIIKWIPFQHQHEGKAVEGVPHDWLVQDETRQELYAALQTLKKEHREVLIYRKIEELSVDETCDILGWKPMKVANTQRAAMKALEKRLGGAEHGFKSFKGTE